MRRPRAALLAGLVAGLSLLALTGCAQDPHPVALTRAERVALYERSSSQSWEQLAQLSPESLRPDLRVRTVSTGSQWALDMAACLRQSGITNFSVTADGAITVLGGQDESTGAGDLPEFVCQAQHPNSLYLRWYLSDSQLSVLYDYYVDFLQPCLLVHTGRPIQHTPSRSGFISSYYVDSWSPYGDSRIISYQVDKEGRTVPSAVLKACPPYPPWLHF